MASYKILFPFILVSVLNIAAIEAQNDPTYLYESCSNFTNSAFQFNLKTLLSNLSTSAVGDTQFRNITINGIIPSDSVYGMFMCRGDVLPQLCHQCVLYATEKLLSDNIACKEGVIWYYECMVRYSNNFFFSTVDTTRIHGFFKSVNASNPKSFMPILFATMNQTADEASPHPIGHKKYATRKANMSESQTLYCLAQCTPDLSPRDCRTCLSIAIRDLSLSWEGQLSWVGLYTSCTIRFEVFPFYLSLSPTLPPPLVPATNTSKFSEDLVYLSHNCSNNETFTANNTFHIDLMTLLSYLSSNATSGKEFHTTIAANRVYGLFMCQGDLPPRLCGQCVLNATHRISSQCHSMQEAVIWYNNCMLRYSHHYFFHSIDTSSIYSKLNITSTSSPNPEQNFFIIALSNTLSVLAFEAGKSDEKYGTKSQKLNDLQTLYTSVQCTQDLSVVDCWSCLDIVIMNVIPWSRLGGIGGTVLYPSCNLRFESFQFYRNGDEAQSPTSASPSELGPTENKRGLSHTFILIIVPIIASVILFSFACYLLKRATRNNHMAILRENFGHETATLEPLQFTLAIIKVATKNFSDENKIGKGGFGEVYKGILFDGRQIAVKRLSKSSKQGANEFKNEVLLIAKLQHRNLVTFIGFCLEEQEKILVYEYVPNKSLDYILFDSQQQKVLSWFERFTIIGGIARGILYLHEHSRLKVIHRDLKPNNILLDENMIPKISDFGLARIVELNIDQGSTSRVVGTYGYISPEYAMFGYFSEKSDVFSFGVMVLEIISGKKNLSTFDSHCISDGLLSNVWRQWRNQMPLSILDPNIKENYSEFEVIKCIQIGLLCVQQNPDDRPTIETVISYLSNDSIELPNPQVPAFFISGRMDPKDIAQSSFCQSINSCAVPSNNEMSMSTTLLPR